MGRTSQLDGAEAYPGSPGPAERYCFLGKRLGLARPERPLGRLAARFVG